MKKTGHAYFVDYPRTMADLKQPHDIRLEREYKVVKTIRLGAMDYENFITDMVADRQFIEDHRHLCSEGEIWECLLVQQRGKEDGVLVIPEEPCYVKYAAYAENQPEE